MPAAMEFRKLWSGHETGTADQVRGDKEMTAPAVLLQKIRSPKIGSGAAIIESEQHRILLPLPNRGPRQYPGSGWNPVNSCQMLSEPNPRQLVNVAVAAAEAATIPIIAVDHVVVQ
jgi:hypothetical protein